MPTACATGGGNAFPIIRQAADARVERELAALRERQVVEPLRGNPVRVLRPIRPDKDNLVPLALHLLSTLSSVSMPIQLSINKINLFARATNLSTSEQASHSCPS